MCPSSGEAPECWVLCRHPGEQTPIVTQRLPSEPTRQQRETSGSVWALEDHTFLTASIEGREGPNVCSGDANPSMIHLPFLTSHPEKDAPDRNPLNGAWGRKRTIPVYTTLCLGKNLVKTVGSGAALKRHLHSMIPGDERVYPRRSYAMYIIHSEE